MRGQKYRNIKKIRADLDQMNKDFYYGNEDFNDTVVGIVCNMKSQYAYLKCVYKDCKYEHWFKYD